jgi:hypothetical protein
MGKLFRLLATVFTVGCSSLSVVPDSLGLSLTSRPNRTSSLAIVLARP